MQPSRLLITGASGAGTTTLGRALADKWSVPHADVDDYFWLPTSPPYTDIRPADERLSLMNAVFVPRHSWILSGSLMGWGDSLIEKLDGVVFLTVDPEIRLERLKRREAARSGVLTEPAQRQVPRVGGRLDDPNCSGRSRTRHELWLAAVPCPVLRLNSAEAVPRLMEHAMATSQS